MSGVVEREILVALLEQTREEATALGNLRAHVRITGDALHFLLERLKQEGLIKENGGLIEASPVQRLEMAVKAVKLGADFERVCRALGWLEFEEMVAHILEENGYRVRRRFRFKAKGRRWEVDVLAYRHPLVLCIECKRWTRGMGNSAVRNIMETHLEKVRVLSEKLVTLSPDLGLRMWTKAVVVPLTLSLSQASTSFHGGAPIVSVLKLPDFLSEFEGRMDNLFHFEVKLPTREPAPSQTLLRFR